VFITAVPIMKVFAREGDSGEFVPVVYYCSNLIQSCTLHCVRIGQVPVCVFITAVPITKLFACGGGNDEDMCYERRRAEACVD
jgi:hypothetical protein